MLKAVMFPWVPFLSYIFIMAYTPGPNNIMSMNNAAKFGFKKAIGFNFGVFAGTAILMILCAVFSSALYTLVPKMQLPMKIVGAAYMLYLIIITLLPSKSHIVKDSNGTFLAGALLQFINPKIIMYGITAMSSYILPHYTFIPILLVFCISLSFIAFAATLSWSLFGSVFSILFDKHRAILNIIMAVLLLYCAISLFL
jgi:threonine/homoserine/homoserine lactone efflux protein